MSGPSIDAAMRIGGSTYSKEPFPKQIADLRELGFDYAEFDLTHVALSPEKLAEEAKELAAKLPLETAHLPPARFDHADLARFVGFMDALAPLGTRTFNAHLLEVRSGPRISIETKVAWFGDLVRAATDRDVVVTAENVDEAPGEIRRVLDAVPDLRFCLDLGHAHLDARADGGRQYLEALGDRLGLVHAHDNHGGHGKAGDEHLPFGLGTIDLERDARAIAAAGFDGRATLELFSGTLDERKGSLRKMRRWARA